MEDGGMARVTLARHFRLRPRAAPDTAALLRRHSYEGAMRILGFCQIVES